LHLERRSKLLSLVSGTLVRDSRGANGGEEERPLREEDAVVLKPEQRGESEER